MSSNNKMKEVELLDLCNQWRMSREEYPGWIICPLDNRTTLKSHTEQWITYIQKNISCLNLPDQILLLRELNWRLEKCLELIEPELESCMERTLDEFLNKINVSLSQKEISKQLENVYSFQDSRAELKSSSIELCFSLLRSFRESIDEEKFKAWAERISPTVEQKAEWVCRLCYERCLFALNCLDINAARQILKRWPEAPELVFWEAKRASLLAEIRSEQAIAVSERALEAVRNGQGKGETPDEIHLFSLEGWLMIQLRHIKRSQAIFYNFTEENERFRALGQYNADASKELDNLYTSFELESRREQKSNGQVNLIQTQSSAKLILKSFLSFLRGIEECCLPYRIVGRASIVALPQKSIYSLEHLFYLDPIQASLLAIRSNQNKFLELLTPEIISLIRDDEANKIHQKLKVFLDQFLLEVFEKLRQWPNNKIGSIWNSRS